jgi:hypothetical protein
MSRRLWFGLFPLACACLCLLATRAETRVSCDGKVCPCYLWGSFGGYFSYYALICHDGTPVALNLPNQVVPKGCADPCTDCVDQVKARPVDPTRAKPPGKVHYHHDKLKAGVTKGAPKTKTTDYLVHDKTMVECKELGDPIVVEIQTKADKSYTALVVLYLIHAKPLKPVPAKATLPRASILATGIEVDPKQTTEKPVATIEYKDVLSTDGQICTVQYGPVVYEVVLDKDAKIDPRPEVAPKKPGLKK